MLLKFIRYLLIIGIALQCRVALGMEDPHRIERTMDGKPIITAGVFKTRLDKDPAMKAFFDDPGPRPRDFELYQKHDSAVRMQAFFDSPAKHVEVVAAIGRPERKEEKKRSRTAQRTTARTLVCTGAGVCVGATLAIGIMQEFAPKGAHQVGAPIGGACIIAGSIVMIRGGRQLLKIKEGRRRKVEPFHPSNVADTIMGGAAIVAGCASVALAVPTFKPSTAAASVHVGKK